MKDIQLSYQDNFISFDFVALNYRASADNQYAYKLEGFDNDWIYCGIQRSASYTNLQGGTYAFRVKGSNNDGIWNEEGTSIGIEVVPPFWQTWWFRLVALTSILLLIFLIYEIRTYAIRRTNKKLKEVNIRLNQQIEERKQAEKALQASEKKYRKIIENTIDVYYRADLEGKLIMVSPSGVKLAGYKNADELLGKNISESFYFNPDARKRFLEALKKQGKVVNYEITLKRKNGEPLIAEASSHLFYNENGEPEYEEGMLRDITARKRAEEENARLQDQLLNARKMESVGNLAGGMAHEFNNLLAVITGYAELLQEEIGEAPPVSRQLDAIIKAANRCSALTDQLLSFSRKQVLKLKAVDVNNLIANMETRIHQIVNEKVKMITKLEAKPARINVDPNLMSQVIIGIVENSRDAMPDGGVLTIQTEIVELDKENNSNPQPVFHQDGKFVCLLIEDTGIGMDEETLQHVFEPFFTTKEVGKGVGLDLSFVYGTIGQHGGWIDVTSTPGQGTQMKIYLPVSV
jgi:PAS domain S-box-containing protein